MLQRSKLSQFSLDCLEISDFYISWTALTHQSIGILDEKYMDLIDQLQMNKAINDCCLIPSQFLTKKKAKTLRELSIASIKPKKSKQKKQAIVSSKFSSIAEKDNHLYSALNYYTEYAKQEQRKPRRSFVLPKNSFIKYSQQSKQLKNENKTHEAKGLDTNRRHQSDKTLADNYYTNNPPKSFRSTLRWFNHNSSNNQASHQDTKKVQYSQATKSILQKLKNKNHQVFLAKKKPNVQKDIIKLPYLNRVQSNKLLQKIHAAHPPRIQISQSQNVSPRDRLTARVNSQPSLRIRKIKSSQLWRKDIIDQKLKTAVRVLNQSQSNVTTSKLNQDL